MAAGVTLKHKRKGSAFTGGDLAVGEWGLNTATGEWYYSNDGTTVTKIPSLLTPQNFASQYASEEHPGGDTGAGTVTINWNNGNCQRWRLTGNCTFAEPSNPIAAGARYALRIVGDGSSIRTPVWPSSFIWSDGASAPAHTSASKTYIVSAYYTGTNYLCQYTPNFDTVT